MNVQQLAKEIATRHAGDLDLEKREFSYGETANSLLQADRTGIKLGWKVTNNLQHDKVLYIGAKTLFHTDLDVGTDTVLPGGIPTSDVQFKTGAQLVNENDHFTIQELNSDRKIADFRGFASHSPVQITKLHLKSRAMVSNQPAGADDSNYESPIVAYHVSPFYDTKKKEFQLRTLQDSSMNSPQYATADFLAEGFDAIISDENVLAIRVTARTELVITAHVGAFDSRAQYFYRQIRKANKALGGIRAIENVKKGC